MTNRTWTPSRRRRTGRLAGLALGATLMAVACSNKGEAIGVASGPAASNQSDASTTALTDEAPTTAPTTEAPTTEAPDPADASERPSQEELAGVLAASIVGTPAAAQLSVDQISCIAGVMIDSQLPDHVLVATVNNTPTLTEEEDQQLRQQTEAATLVCR